MTNKNTSQIKAFTLMAALVVLPQITNAGSVEKAKCGGCCAEKNSTSQNSVIGSIIQTGKPLQLADAGSSSLSKEASSALKSLVAIQKSLAADSMDHVPHHAKAIATAAKGHKVHGLAHAAADQALAVEKAKDIKSAREAFKKLSESFTAYLKQHPDKSGTYRVAYCPMAKAAWVQTGNTIANPYFGSKMLKCGSFKS